MRADGEREHKMIPERQMLYSHSIKHMVTVYIKNAYPAILSISMLRPWLMFGSLPCPPGNK